MLKMYIFFMGDDGPGPMDIPRQSDSLAGYMEGQIIGIACGPVGVPLYNHERRVWTQKHLDPNTKIWNLIFQNTMEVDENKGDGIRPYFISKIERIQVIIKLFICFIVVWFDILSMYFIDFIT